VTAIAPPPASYDGRFSAFYERYIEPNLPTNQKVREFDLRLRQYLSEQDPVHVVRYVKGLTRGTIYRTCEGLRILPTDNAPVWWVHSLLHSQAALPEDGSDLFETMPHHFFRMAGIKTLNQAGYHAAHILPAKNRETDWQRWTRSELARRMFVNIHPCNIFLVAKTEWTQNGGRPDIIAWIIDAYLHRYGSTMERFLADCASEGSLFGRPTEDPIYRFSAAQAAESDSSSKLGGRSPRRKAPRTIDIGIRRTKRPMIWRKLVGQGISLDITMDGSRYLLPHDDLVVWVQDNTTALETASWLEHGFYSWPRASYAMLRFLQNYQTAVPSLSGSE
jgi:hypothetical protein